MLHRRCSFFHRNIKVSQATSQIADYNEEQSLDEKINAIRDFMNSIFTMETAVTSFKRPENS